MEVSMKQHYLLNEVARKLKRKPYQITYMLSTGIVKEPKLRVCNKRMFTTDDIEQLRQAFSLRDLQEAHG